ncbi:MAG: cardiolipin synthase [Oleispira sp.]|nr:cardiolipin synthase [Oleispira sp.]
MGPILPWIDTVTWTDSITWSWTLIIYCFGLAAAIDAIWNGRTSQGTLAWVVALTFIPFISLPLYLFFGSRKFHGYKKARKAGSKALKRLNQLQLFSDQDYQSKIKSTPVIPLEKLAHLPQTEQNEIKLLINGEQTFTHIFQSIEAAKHTILVQFYIVNDDQLGQRLQQALIKKSQQAVTVYFLYDEIGSSQLNRFFLKPMTDAGIHCSRFNHFQILRHWQINFRNHRKLIIIDGKTCFIGGHNIGDEYLSRDPSLGLWRDTHLQIDGPATLAAQLSFVEDWHWAQDKIPTLNWQAYTSNQNSKVLIIPGGPADTVETISLSFVQLILQAQQRLWIATPYFIPDLKVMGALQLAALKNIDIRIILPKKTDNPIVDLAMRSYIAELSQLGIQFYQYNAGFMHQKVMLIDQEASYIGSANLDNRSLRINFELNALIECKQLASQVEQMLNQDLLHCRPYPEQKHLLQKLLAKAARLLSPIL